MDGRQYVFELKDRLIRDKELDGQTEISVKPAADDQLQKHDRNDADGHADRHEESMSPTLQGLSCFLHLVSHFVWHCDAICDSCVSIQWHVCDSKQYQLVT